MLNICWTDKFSQLFCLLKTPNFLSTILHNNSFNYFFHSLHFTIVAQGTLSTHSVYVLYPFTHLFYFWNVSLFTEHFGNTTEFPFLQLVYKKNIKNGQKKFVFNELLLYEKNVTMSEPLPLSSHLPVMFFL